MNINFGISGYQNKYSQKQINSIFHQCDTNMKGYLDNEDYKCAILMLFGYKPPKYEVDKVMAHTNSTGKKMDLTTFVHIVTAMAPPDEDEIIRKTFIAFDSQCRGFLTVDDLYKVFAKIAPLMDKKRILDAFREIDRDGDGLISYSDFEFMMKFGLTDS